MQTALTSVVLESGPSRSDAAVRAFGASRDLEDDDQPPRFINHVDDAELTDAQPPVLRPGQLGHTGGSRVDRQRKDRPAKAGGVTRWQPPELALGARRELDPPRGVVHWGSGS